ncbi:hypothetical protein BD560DRAFT_395457 [Blakeslea trispora]|nr:hypothetical protein BD560DRAFT_395457 [Blakeslea trispora]
MALVFSNNLSFSPFFFSFSRIMKLFNLSLALLLTVSNTQAQEFWGGRSCGFLSGKIYCFFGNRLTNATQSALDNTINVLDLTNATGKSASELQSSWTTLTSNTNGVDISPRLRPQSAEMGNGRHMFFNGGYTYTTERLKDPNIIYDAVENRWSSHTPYTEPPYGPRQIYFGSAIYVPDRGMALYGGHEEFINPNWTTYSVNVSEFTFSDSMSRVIGFTQVAYFQMNSTLQPWTISASLESWVHQFLAHQKSVYDPKNRRILFIGGVFRRNEHDVRNLYGERFPLSQAWVFDTVISGWNAVNLGGQIPKDGRTSHTLSLAPSTERDVIMYGGEVNGTASDEYCFVLNLDSNEWKRIDIAAPSGTALERTEHSAVVTGNNTLLIIWGIGRNNTPSNSILMLDITNPERISLAQQYQVHNSSFDNPDNSSRRLTGGELGGIIAACAGFGLTAVAVFFFVKRRKSKKRSDKQSLPSQPSTHPQESQDMNLMEVDWDKIEENYTELPTRPAPPYHSPFGASSSVPGTIVKPSEEKGYEMFVSMNPNSVDDDVSAPEGRKVPAILKPDAGYNT